MIARCIVVKSDCSYWALRVDYILVAISMFPMWTRGPCSVLKVIIPQALSFLSSHVRRSLAYSLLAADVALGGGIPGCSSFPEVTHQRPLDFSPLVMSILHDS